MTLRRRALFLAAACAFFAVEHETRSPQNVSAAAAQTSLTAGSGPASATVGPVNLKPGLTVIQVRTNGSGRVSVALLPPSSSGSQLTLFDRNGPFTASAATLVAAQGTYYAQVTAPQACQLLFQQPVPETVEAQQTSTLSGQGKDVSAYFTSPSSVSTLSVQTKSSTLAAWLYHLDDNGGEVVQGGVNGSDGRFFDLAAPGAVTSYPVSLPDAGPYLLAVDRVAPFDPWTFSFS